MEDLLLGQWYYYFGFICKNIDLAISIAKSRNRRVIIGFLDTFYEKY